MANTYFQFKQFLIHQDRTAMKVTTDGCLFGAWCAEKIRSNNPDSGKSLLDIGTGTGLLSLMIAQKNHLIIDAIEIDPEGCEQARSNVASSPFKDINILCGDVKMAELKKYDHIVCNPPFYENELPSPHTKRNIAHHAEGLRASLLFRIIHEALKKSGRYYLLLPYKRMNELLAELTKNKLYVNELCTVHQTYRHTPFRIMVEGSGINTPIKYSTITIKGEDELYTTEFSNLLRDYYLHL